MPTLRRPPAVALVLALAAGAVPAAAQNLVQNGGFETPPVGDIATLGIGCPAGFVWCIGQGTIDLVGTYWQPGDGRQSIDLDGATPGSIFQDLATTPGQTYEISFLMSGNPDGTGIETMEIFWGGLDLGTYGWVPGPPQTRDAMFWSPTVVGGLRATSTTTRLEFRSTTTTNCLGVPEPACGPALDAIGVVAVGGPVVPEPATAALVGGGLLGLAAAARRERRRD